MQYVKQARCTRCNKTYHLDDTLMHCDDCLELGILDIEYDYHAMRQTIDKHYFNTNKDYSIWRYKPMMSVANKHNIDTLHVGWTPMHKADNIAKLIKLKTLYLKDDSLNPTGSLKDRASVVAVIKACDANQTIVACSSTGNAATSLAGNAAKVGLKTMIFVPKRIPDGKRMQLSIYGATIFQVDGDYQATYELSKQAIAHFGWYNRNAAINPHLVEGKKTVAYEIAEQLDFKPTDWVIVSVGDGCTIAGVYKGFYDMKQCGLIDKIPKLLGVQSEGCSPFVDAFDTQSSLKITKENTIADSISVGVPRNPIKALNAVKNSKGHWLKVSDQAILESMAQLGSAQGVFAEPAAAASLAGLLEALNKKIISANESVTLIITGNGLKDPKNAMKLIQEKHSIAPSLTAIKQRLNKERKT